MFIQTQSTPNPSNLMFLPGKSLMESGSRDFPNAREAMASPLATALFQIDGVEGVFFGSDFVTVKVRACALLVTRFRVSEATRPYQCSQHRWLLVQGPI